MNNFRATTVTVGDFSFCDNYFSARGKTYISTRLCRYLNWVGLNTRVFNVGHYRRKNSSRPQLAEFFDPKNEKAQKQRDSWRRAALNDIVRWIQEKASSFLFSLKFSRFLAISRPATFVIWFYTVLA